ncbi:MAG TPA: hypothetical protein VFO90_08355 [Terrimicrobiaceae bacterium]|nr:hypothetical protein [Terrimicrobiaceae bacterium]
MGGGKKDEAGKKKDEEITNHNLQYFGQPVYEYSIGDGQEDGYLAACEVIRRTVDLDKKEIPAKTSSSDPPWTPTPGAR